ncbi:MAG TPA: PorP/SprF family type IX secretion system membrane protein [Flavisolibacter sp.]|nr:PorP/SprF family type IX secretion system membrane protein [Flavisolibacter sp.]
MRNTVLFLLFFFSLLSAKAQDPNFSQFFSSPLTLNPALTGKFEGVVRVAGNYRNQWPTINNAYTTYTASIDAGILKNKIPEFDQFGVGVLGFSDKSGNGVLQNNAFALSTSYHKSLDENGYSQLGLGFQGSFVTKNLDVTKVKFLDQLRADGFTGLTQEVFSQASLNISYFDLNVGALYNGTTDGSNNYYVGVSMYHITRPKETFNGGTYVLDPRLTLQAGGRLPLAESDAVHFSAIHSRQANAVNTVLGGAYMMNVNGDSQSPTNLYLGSWFRLGDAVIPYVGLEFGSFHIGATYDVNVSSLKPGSNMRGGAEFSLVYVKKPNDPYAKSVTCPRF